MVSDENVSCLFAVRAPALGSIETGNKLADRPSVRMSKLYREKESGNAMKGIFGQDNLAWDTEKQEGVFVGQSVFDASTREQTAEQSRTAGGMPSHGVATGGAPLAEPEYPNPGSSASCDACGTGCQQVLSLHAVPEVTGLFDLCTECCGAIYLGKGGVQKPQHPTHDYGAHQMQHVAPP